MVQQTKQTLLFLKIVLIYKIFSEFSIKFGFHSLLHELTTYKMVFPCFSLISEAVVLNKFEKHISQDKLFLTCIVCEQGRTDDVR